MDVGNQTITYWAPSGGMDRYGKPNLSAPVQLIGRWEDRVQVVVNKKGEDVTSKSRAFFMDVNIDIDGWMYLGTSAVANPAQQNDALEILAVGRVPDLQNMQALTTVYMR